MAHLKECRTEQEIRDTYRAAHDRLWNPQRGIRIAAAPPPVPKAKPIPRPGDPPLAVADIRIIKKAAAIVFKVPAGRLASHDTRERVLMPRWVAMYLARTMTGASTTDIGRAFGKRDHTSVLHALRETARRLESDPEFAERVARVRDRVMRYHRQQQTKGSCDGK